MPRGASNWFQVKIVCRELTFSYPESDHPLFAGLNLSITGTGFFSFFGLSGSGKSTLARLVAGLLAPDSGRIMKTETARDLFSYNTERLPGWMTLEEHLNQVVPGGREELLDSLTDEFGITPFMEHKFPKLSMGQKNRVNLVRYLIQDFDLLIADEVLANVDEPSRNRILGFIKRHFPDRAFIYISHNASEVALFSKRIFVFPQTGPEGLSGLISIDGLDVSGPQEADRNRLQEKILEILKASSQGRWQENR